MYRVNNFFLVKTDKWIFHEQTERKSNPPGSRKIISLRESCLHQFSQITELIFVDSGGLGACVKIVLFLYANTNS